MATSGPAAERQLSDRRSRKAELQQTTQLQPLAPNVPTTCRLVFKLASVTNYAQLLKPCLEIMVQDDINYRHHIYSIDVSVPPYGGACDVLDLPPRDPNKNARSVYFFSCQCRGNFR